jgi:hypothetical protein
MSAHFICPICGEPFEHGPHDLRKTVLGSSVQACPKGKGAIYVYVQDDRGAGLQGSTVNCAGKTPDSDKEGYAIFDQLNEQIYPTSIGPKLTSGYYLFSPKQFQAAARDGQVTLVAFQLNPYCRLKVAVKRADKNNEYLKDVLLKVSTEAPDALANPPEQKSLATAPVEFQQLGRVHAIKTIFVQNV